MAKGIEVTLPIIKRSWLTGKTLKRKYGKRVFYLDMSLAAEERFEQNFPKVAERYGDLTSYMNMVHASIENIPTRANVLSMLKAMYCWFDTDMQYIPFLQMFDTTDIDYMNELANKLKLAWSIILDNACEKN